MRASIVVIGQSELVDALHAEDFGMSVDWLSDLDTHRQPTVGIVADSVLQPLSAVRELQRDWLERPALILCPDDSVSARKAELMTAVGVGPQVEILATGDRRRIVQQLRRALNRGLNRQRFAAQLKQADASLEQSGTYYPKAQGLVSTLLQALPVGVMAIDARQRVIHANPAAMSLAQLPEAHTGQTWTANLEPQAAARASALVGAAINGREHLHHVLRQSHDNGQHSYTELTVVPSPEDNRPGVALLLLQDVTGRYRAELLRAQSEKALAQASQAKSSFLATMSHEIRTPLHGILGLIELHARSDLDPNQRRHVRMLQESADTLRGLIDDVLDISKIEAGHFELDARPFWLRELTDRVIKTYASVGQKKGLRMGSHCPPGLPALVGDEKRLRQVLSNLVSNAVKFTEKGYVHLRADARPGAKGKVHLCFSVSDSGAGIDAADQALIFQGFGQGSAGRRQAGGTGLGLAISRGLVELMGGQLELEPGRDQGSCFRVTLELPVDPDSTTEDCEQRELRHWRVCVAAADEQETAELGEDLRALGCDLLGEEDADIMLEAINLTDKRGASSPALRLRSEGDNQILQRPVSLADLRDALLKLGDQTPGLRQDDTAGDDSSPIAAMHLLIAEDNPVNRDLIAHQLGSAGCTATVVEDGQQAWEALAAQDYDLLITDMRMPELNGYELTRRIRQHQLRARSGRPLPVLALTASVERSELQHCHDCGVDEVLSKPLTLQQLKQALQRWQPLPAAGQP